MRWKFLIGIAACLFAAASVEAGNPLKVPRLTIEQYMIDIGEQPYVKDGSFVAKFPYQNRGEGDLRIDRVIPGCSCIHPEFSREPLKMGQTDTITVTFHPDHSGKFSQMLTICSNSHKSLLNIYFVGDLVETK